MALKEKEITALKDLQTQEQTCIDKYEKYSEQAKDPVLKDLFLMIRDKEQEHFDMLGQAMKGKVKDVDLNVTIAEEYEPEATYTSSQKTKDKTADSFLATDAIVSEKLVSGEYNSDVFIFADNALRKLLALIQVEEQNHAEMLYKYKTVNGMA